MRWRGALLVLCALCASCAGEFVAPAPATDRASLFDTVWREFDMHYSFFQLKGIDWNAVGARHRDAALAAPSDKDFAKALSAMFAELRDVHVSLSTAGAGSTVRYVSPFDTIPTYFSERIVFGKYATSTALTSGNHLRYGMVAPGVGYVRISSFVGGDWSGEMDEALAALSSASALIVDVRNNGGGSRAAANGVAARFADRTYTFGYLRYRNGRKHSDFTDYVAETVAPTGRHFGGRVVVLTNRRAFSSAEDFVLAMRALPRSIVVGDTTGGASGGPMVRELPNGWTYELSQWIEYTPDKRTFEGIGLAPTVVVRSSSQDFLADRDPILEEAIARASQR